MTKQSLKIKDWDDSNFTVKLRFGIIDTLTLRLKRVDTLRFTIIITNTVKWETRRFTSDRTRNKTNIFNIPLVNFPGERGDPFNITVKVYRFRAGQYATHLKNYEIKNQTIPLNKTQISREYHG